MSNNFFQEGQKKYDTIPIPEDLELNLKRTIKCAESSKKSMPTIKILGGLSAAIIIFIIVINLSPQIAFALNNVPLLKNLVQLVTYDKGFNNLTNNDRVQQINYTAEDKGVKFTVNSIVGDDLKLWIGYDLHENGLFIGQVKFKTKGDDKELPWKALISSDHKNYLEVSVDKLVKDFIMEVPVYKDDPLFHKPVAEMDEKTLINMKSKLDQSRLTTLSIPLSLNNKIYKDDLVTINEKNKEYKSQIGTFRLNKLQLSESRSIVYLQLISDNYELIGLENPMLVDGNGNVFSYPSNYENLAANNNITIELAGGIKDDNSLTFECSGVKYISKKDKHITIDVRNKMIEQNNLGIKLVNIEGSKITLNATKGKINFDLLSSNEKGKNITIDNITTDSFDGKQVLEFKNLNSEKIILNVLEADNSKINGFQLKLGN